MPVQVIHQLTLDPLLESVEQMVGLMLNESLETSGNGPAAEHRLAGVQITSPNGIHSLLNLGWLGKRHWVHGIIRKKVFLGAWLERHQSWIASFK